MNEKQKEILRRIEYRAFKPIESKIARRIFVALAVTAAVPFVLTSPFGLYFVIRGAVRYAFNKGDFHRELKRLEKRGFVSLKKTPDGVLVKLLKKGLKRKRHADLQELKLPKPSSWDKKWRFYIFDISEKAKNERDQLTRTLKTLGMYHVQRSVFAYPYDCRAELEQVGRYYKVSSDATYIESDFTDISRELKKHFKL